MGYRNGVYIAFDGGGSKDVTSGDIWCYYLMQAWKKEDPTFNFVDSHDKTGNARDTSTSETLKRHFRERISGSKIMILILSNETRYFNENLNFEVSEAKRQGIKIYAIKTSNKSFGAILKELNSNDIEDYIISTSGMKVKIKQWIISN